jgi:DNA-binding NarL/FixJ family response regulator
LLVDDFEQWRLAARSILEKVPAFRVISEAGDGLEAVEKAATLLPDVIVLDIGMPLLNGIEAARRIRQASPESRIVFLTENDD